MKSKNLILDGYILEENPIGMGSFAKVYKGDHPILKRSLAFKICTEEGYREYFIDEAKMLSELDHPNILQPINFSSSDEMVYFSMPYIVHKDNIHNIDDYIKINGRFDIEISIKIAVQILDALAYSHSKGKIHRDIHPRNILLKTDFFAFLTDFNLAKDISKQMDYFSRSKSLGGGGSDYQTPEQRNKKYEEINTKTDVYQFALVFNKMLLGQWSNTPPAKIDSSIPKDLSDLVEACLENDGRNRPTSKEFYNRLCAIKLPGKSVAENKKIEAYKSRINDVLNISGVLTPEEIFVLERVRSLLYIELARIGQPVPVPEIEESIMERFIRDEHLISDFCEKEENNLKQGKIKESEVENKIKILDLYLDSYKTWKKVLNLK